MKYTEGYRGLVDLGVSDKIALMVQILIALNVTKKIKPKHITGVRKYEEELIELFKSTMFEEDIKLVEKAIKVWKIRIGYCDLSPITFEGFLKERIDIEELKDV